MKNGINLDLYFSIHVIQTMQMDRQWMHKADRRTKEFIDGLHYFLNVARQTSRMVSCAAHAYTARIIKIIPLEQPFTVTFSVIVSCSNNYVGPNMEERVL